MVARFPLHMRLVTRMLEEVDALQPSEDVRLALAGLRALSHTMTTAIGDTQSTALVVHEADKVIRTLNKDVFAALPSKTVHQLGENIARELAMRNDFSKQVQLLDGSCKTLAAGLIEDYRLVNANFDCGLAYSDEFRIQRLSGLPFGPVMAGAAGAVAVGLLHALMLRST